MNDKKTWSIILLLAGFLSFLYNGSEKEMEVIVLFIGGLLLWYLPSEKQQDSGSTEHQDKLLTLLQRHSHAMGKGGRSSIFTEDKDKMEK